MQNDTLFTKKAQASDEIFIALRDDPLCESDRRYVDKLWGTYRPYADHDFPTKIAHAFHSCFWEMHLTCSLLEIGFPVQSKNRGKPEGPDIRIAESNRSVWIEATQLSRGSGPDAVPERKRGIWTKIPENALLLRYTAAIREKSEKHRQYVSKNIVPSTDPYIIAINGSNLGDILWPDDYPRIVKSVLGLGHQRWVINYDTNEAKYIGYDARSSIVKASGSQVSTETFTAGEYKEISGLIFSSKNIEQRPDLSGKSFIFIHNPMALHPVRLGWFPAGREYWLENDEIKFKRW